MLTEALQMAVSTPPLGPYRCCVRIADVSIGLNGNLPADVRLSPELDAFCADSLPCDIEAQIAWTARLPRAEGRKLFDSGSLWTLYASGSGLVFDFTTPVLGTRPYKRLCVDQEFSAARLLLNRECLSDLDEVYPLEYPLDELLVTHWLAGGRGVEVHGCGVVDSEAGGLLFLGHSGAGKSTTTRLWSSLRKATVLSDDRIILREHAGEIWMHGTPWHGEAGFALAGKAKLNRIFFLEHGAENQVSDLSKSRAVGELFARCFVPFHGHAPLQQTLAYLDRVASTVPCYGFQFLPDRSAVEKILDFHG